ncbi:hypothetical protein EF888_06550 [Silicimonas algicola]|uniref:Site-specific recombinase XerD n=1 Tax=Silicimonas algicola TaxID=1826607 RepID=A0A316G5N3_9RHOB|nr:tyrosine-type recombinase/integrase [Silicimonas algicola]AZQ66829.1 hypothetical protein EF888_06550 [Silicimonas algicola]PWK55266.1 site-specific recombinase XerD [Silicimonas algicola]
MTKRIKLTKAVIDGLHYERDGGQVSDLEVPELKVRLTPTAKTYEARWTSKTEGRVLTRKIARVGEISVSEARDRARKIVAEDLPRAVETLRDVFKVWDQTYSSAVSAGHAEEFRRTWAKHIEPDLGHLKLTALTHNKLQGWYNKKRTEYPLSPKGKARTKPNSAATVRRWIAYVSKLCAIARKLGYMVGNPTEGLEMATPSRRLDLFNREDIRTLGDNLTGIENRYPIGAALIRFLMIFPCRGIEAREMLWRDVDLEAGTWTIPADRYKTGQDKVFPLGPLQVDHLRNLPRWSDTYVFPRPSSIGVGRTKTAQTDSDLPVTKNHQIHVWKKVRPKPLGAHTLRRTIGHLLLNKNVPLEVVSKLLGHSNTLVTQQIYARLDPQTAAKHLAVWSTFLEDDEAETEPHFVDYVLKQQSKIAAHEYNKKLVD